MRRLALVLVVFVAAGSLAACGSGKKSPSGPSAQDQIKSAYTKFFASKTSLADRVALLQDGSKFKTVIQAFASNPLAKNVKVDVSSVTLQGADNAKVVYVVTFSGTALPKQNGTAVLENGTWKVGFASLCKLVGLSGTTPAACKS